MKVTFARKKKKIEQLFHFLIDLDGSQSIKGKVSFFYFLMGLHFYPSIIL